MVSVDDIDKFKKKEMKKINFKKSVKSTWHDWLINYIPEPITKV